MERKEKHFIAEVDVCEGFPIRTFELARTRPCHDAAGTYISNPVWQVMEIAVDRLKDMVDNGEISQEDICSINIRELQPHEEE